MVVFIVALKGEAESIIRALEDVHIEKVCGREVAYAHSGKEKVAVVTCGVGKTAAASAAQWAIDQLGATLLVSAGTAGGLKPTMRPCTVYVPTRAVQYDFDLTAINSAPLGTLNERDTPYFTLCSVPDFPDEIVATGDRFSNDEAEIAQIVRIFDAGIREMEVAAEAHVAELAQIPLVAFKVLTNVVGGSDTMSDQFEQRFECACSALTEALMRWIKAGMPWCKSK